MYQTSHQVTPNSIWSDSATGTRENLENFECHSFSCYTSLAYIPQTDLSL